MFITDNYTEIHPIFSKVSLVKKYVDIDGDGYVDNEDLMVFLKRYQKMEYAKSVISQSVCSYRTDLKRYALYPTKQLAEEKALEILNKLREILQKKNMNYKKFFMLIDSNGDGLISCDEFL